MNRRKFLRNSLLATGACAVAGGLYAWQIEPFWLEFVRREMPIAGLPSDLEGKTLMQISDIHVGNVFDYQFLIDSFLKASMLKPDIVVYTGDFVSYEDEEQFGQLSEVLAHAVHGNIGTYAVLGNHDYGDNWSEQPVADEIRKIIERNGVRLLNNELEMAGGLQVVGFDDVWGLDFNPEAALHNYDSTNPAVLLCHNPDVCDMDVWQDYNGWILSGHTHGGQVKPPFLDPPVLPVKNTRYTAGEFDLVDHRKLYINRALGNLMHVRLNVRPEITVFKMTGKVG